jgi:hypothetical protein
MKPNTEICLEPGCSNRLGPNNKSGYCPDHAYIPSRVTLSAIVRDCKFQGGVGHDPKYRPEQSCLRKFNPTSHNQKNCDVCKRFARLAHNAEIAAANYRANTLMAAKKALENRHKRLKKTGKAIVRLGVMVRCEYRTKARKRGKDCLGTFKRTRPLQKFCENCRRLADAQIAKDSRERHHLEIKARNRDRAKKMRKLAHEAVDLREKLAAVEAELERTVAADRATKKPGTKGRKRKDDVADRVIRLKADLSWTQLTIKMNEEAVRSGLEELTEEAYRSLYRSRKKKLGDG